MDTKEYIASGIIESYALGFASDQERREVECLSSIYPEIKQELVDVQASLEKYAESIAVQPPQELKASILEKIKSVPQDKAPIVALPQKEEEKTPAKVISMNNMLKYGVAASVVVIVGLAYLFLTERNQTSQLNNQLAEIQNNSSQSLQNAELQMASLKDSLTINEKREFLLLHSRTQEIVLAGTAISPESKVRVFWNDAINQYVIVSDELPTPGEGKEYQLWAIADGTPKDLGMLGENTQFSDPRNANFANVQAFAITLEKAGGVESPTLDQMYVVGTTKS